MRGIRLTYANMMASSRDAGNASMRKGCRKAWNEQDSAAAQAVIDRLAPHVMAEQFGISFEAARAICEAA